MPPTATGELQAARVLADVKQQHPSKDSDGAVSGGKGRGTPSPSAAPDPVAVATPPGGAVPLSKEQAAVLLRRFHGLRYRADGSGFRRPWDVRLRMPQRLGDTKRVNVDIARVKTAQEGAVAFDIGTAWRQMHPKLGGGAPKDSDFNVPVESYKKDEELWNSIRDAVDLPHLRKLLTNLRDSGRLQRIAAALVPAEPRVKPTEQIVLPQHQQQKLKQKLQPQQEEQQQEQPQQEQQNEENKQSPPLPQRQQHPKQTPPQQELPPQQPQHQQMKQKPTLSQQQKQQGTAAEVGAAGNATGSKGSDPGGRNRHDEVERKVVKTGGSGRRGAGMALGASSTGPCAAPVVKRPAVEAAAVRPAKRASRTAPAQRAAAEAPREQQHAAEEREVGAAQPQQGGRAVQAAADAESARLEQLRHRLEKLVAGMAGCQLPANPAQPPPPAALVSTAGQDAPSLVRAPSAKPPPASPSTSTALLALAALLEMVAAPLPPLSSARQPPAVQQPQHLPPPQQQMLFSPRSAAAASLAALSQKVANWAAPDPACKATLGSSAALQQPASAFAGVAPVPLQPQQHPQQQQEQPPQHIRELDQQPYAHEDLLHQLLLAAQQPKGVAAGLTVELAVLYLTSLHQMAELYQQHQAGMMTALLQAGYYDSAAALARNIVQQTRP